MIILIAEKQGEYTTHRHVCFAKEKHAKHTHKIKTDKHIIHSHTTHRNIQYKSRIMNCRQHMARKREEYLFFYKLNDFISSEYY